MGELATEVRLAQMALRALKNNNLAINLFYKDLQSEFKAMPESGGIVNVKKPIKFQSYKGVEAKLQPYKEETIPVKVDNIRGVAWSQNQVDATLSKSPEKLYEMLIEPAMIEISTQIDLELFTMVNKVANGLGTPGNTPSAYLTIAQVAARATNIAVPDSKRKMVVTPTAQAVLADALKDVFHEGRVEKALEKMYIGGLAKMEFFISSSLPRLIKGTPGGTPKVNGANQTGTSVIVDGFAAAGTLKAGEIITFSNVYDVHPVTRQAHTYLKQFVLNSDFTADGGGEGTLDIRPSIVTEGAYQNCSVGPANNADIVQVTNADCVSNIMFYPDAFCVQFVPIKIPDMQGVGHTETREGISVTVTKGWDVMKLQMVYRVDVLYGYRELYPEQAVRLFGE